MSDAQRTHAEADRLLNEPLLKDALSALSHRLIEELLAGPPTDCADPDRWRRERIDMANAVRAIPQVLKTTMLTAEADMRVRGGVA